MMVRALVGTDKGGFVIRSDDRRRDWSIDGPLFKGWKVTAAVRDGSGRFLVATASQVYGTALHVSDDLATWRQLEAGPAYAKDSGRKLNQIWTLRVVDGRIFAGVDEAGLFVSDDGGERWQPVDALNEHATRSAWFPGAGGLCLHAILADPRNPKRMWCGISAVGVFRTEDGGGAWTPVNEGIPAVIEDEQHKDIGRCVHALVADPDDANVIYRREHNGMFRSADGGDHWQRIEAGLASWFGFPIAMDPGTRALFVIPLESDEYRLPPDGRLEVYRSTDGGDSWASASRGLPDDYAYTGVLRGAMDADGLDPGGVYFGTTSGTVHVSNDAGDSWTQLPCLLPRVLTLSVFVDA